ncbi:MAG: sialate O-acetylesterase [Kiritimatiellia bacterium]
MNNMKLIAAAVLAVAAAGAANAKVAAGTPFADNMVLQRGRAVPVWGHADPGEAVTVSFAGQTKSTTADATGAWRVMLDPMPASKESRELKVTGAANAEAYRNVLVGEVWFASGQSNMECPIWGASPRYRDGKGGVMTAMTRRPYIRYAKNARVWSAEPKRDWKAAWHDFSPESFRATFNNNLSAVAFYYALELYGALEVPVGIVDSSWGGTNIDAWTPRSGYANHPELKDVADFPVTAQWRDEMRRGPIGGAQQQPTALWNGMVAAWAPYAIKGFIWYQGCHNNGEAFRYCDKMHALYDGWAKEFENPDLKLYFVMLAPFKANWFNLQQAQSRFAAEQPNAALAVTCDAGNLFDIHPNDKEIVAKRLALHALKRDYGFTDIVDNSPTLKSWKVDEGGRMLLTFNDAKGWYLYNADRSGVQGFEIAGPDGKFVPAKVLNKNVRGGTLEGDELIVFAEGVRQPKRLRYLASSPWTGALYAFNSGLPVGPFEIDARQPGECRRGEPVKLGAALAIPELAGFRKVLSADLPISGAFAEKGYALDETAKAGAFARVAYALELECRDGSVDWVVASMDAFTPEAAKLGVPAVSGARFQQKVGRLTVRSNQISVKEVTDHDGGSIEFFNFNYGPRGRLPDVGGSNELYDFNDEEHNSNNGKPGYGAMQIHDWKNGATVFAYNNFNHGVADVGIGNGPGKNPDWTFEDNAAWYKTRRLTILVK